MTGKLKQEEKKAEKKTEHSNYLHYEEKYEL